MTSSESEYEEPDDYQAALDEIERLRDTSRPIVVSLVSAEGFNVLTFSVHPGGYVTHTFTDPVANVREVVVAG